MTAGHLREWVRKLDREKTIADAKIPLTAIESTPLSPNQERAMRFAAIALEEKRRRGELNPEVIVSNPGGTRVVTSSKVPVTEAPRREVLVHAAWFTPTPRELAALVRVPNRKLTAHHEPDA